MSSRQKLEYKTMYNTFHTSPRSQIDEQSKQNLPRTFPYNNIPQRQYIPEKAVLYQKLTEYNNPLHSGGRPDYSLMTQDIRDDYWARSKGSYLPHGTIEPASLREPPNPRDNTDFHRDSVFFPLNPNYPILSNGTGICELDDDDKHQETKRYANCTEIYPSLVDEPRLEQVKKEYKQQQTPSLEQELNSSKMWKQGIIGKLKVKKSPVINANGDRYRVLIAGLDNKGKI
ncbi:MAG: hypothetical protein EZS28_043619 [Streblomastix strix]|uniref:Uncharacterized protein n=1 Tax=Streblomastix strix TaxID=222440 RepID=A0A5J4TR80_9EUKA|nr:MAG: hypothetical protein EZS28_043619 [Streblomastix strix]